MSSRFIQSLGLATILTMSPAAYAQQPSGKTPAPQQQKKVPAAKSAETGVNAPVKPVQLERAGKKVFGVGLTDAEKRVASSICSDGWHNQLLDTLEVIDPKETCKRTATDGSLSLVRQCMANVEKLIKNGVLIVDPKKFAANFRSLTKAKP